MNYEVILLPALYVLTALAVIGVLVRGITRTVTEVDDDGLNRVRWSYQGRQLRRAAYIVGVAALVIPALVVTPPGHRGVIHSQIGGVSMNERPEGLSLVLPYWQTPHQVNVRTQRIEIEAYAQSKDLQEITVKASLNYHIEPDRAAEIFQNLGAGYPDTVISPALLQRIDAEVGLIEALNFASARGQLANDIEAALDEQLGGYGIVIEFINIEDAIFDSDFIAAVKAKVIADETAEKEFRLIAAAESQAAQVVAAAEGEAEALLAVATAQAEANRLIDSTLTEQVLDWRQILRWDGILPTTLLAGDEPGILLNVGAAE
jgi:prohibitin 2